MSQEKQTIESANEQVAAIANAHLKEMPLYATIRGNTLREEANTKAELEALSGSDPAKALSNLIESLEIGADLELGIIRTKVPAAQGIAFVGADPQTKTSVVIRDARLQSDPQFVGKSENDVSKNWMIHAAANTKGILKLVELSNHTDKATLQKVIIEQFTKCMQELQEPGTTPEKRTKIVERMNYEMKSIIQPLEINGQKISSLSDKKYAKMLVTARDFTNFDREHPSTITISDNLVNGKQINHIESFVPVAPCSNKVQQRYRQSEEKWREALNPIEKLLVSDYQDKILDDKHMIPTQLQFLPGVRNGGITSTFFANDNEIIPGRQHSAIRSGTPAYNVGQNLKDDKNAMQEITNENVEHLINIGSSSGKKVAFRTITNEIAGEAQAGKAVREAVYQYSNKMSAKKSDVEIKASPLSITFDDKDKNLTEISDRFEDKGVCLHIGCKSGKDRTGLVDQHNNLEVLKEYLKTIKPPLTEKQYDKAYQTYVKAAHNTRLSGGNGGSLGAYGLKAAPSYKLRLAAKNLLNKIKDINLFNKGSADLNATKAKISAVDNPHEIPDHDNSSLIARDKISLGKKVLNVFRGKKSASQNIR